MGGWNVDVGGILGVADDRGERIELRPKERSIVGALALVHPQPATIADIAELVWVEPPATARKAIHNHIARLRRSADGLVESVPGGYRLGDAVVLTTPSTDDVFRDLVDRPEVAVVRTRFRDARLHDEEQRAARSLQRRPDDDTIQLLQAITQAEPHRIERWRLVILALARRGRRRDALEQIRQARAHASSPEDRTRLTRLERAVLHDDPRLEIDHFLAAELTDAGAPNPSRTTELFIDAGGVLDDVIGRIDAGVPGCSVIVGPAGAGKSTVCAHVRDRAVAQGWECHHVEARSHGSAQADLVESLRRSLDERRRSVVDSDVDTAHLLAGDGRRRLVIIDDLHHASADELTAVSSLVAGTADAGQVFWIIASRNEPDLHAATVIPIPPWDATQVGQLLHRFVPPSPWLDGAASWIERQSGGNALAIRELVVDLVRQRAETTDTEGRFTAPAESIAPIEGVRRRVRGLDPHAIDALGGAAMVGSEFSLTTLAAFTDDPVAVASQARLDGVIATVHAKHPRFRFVHDLFRDVLLDELDEDRRSELALLALRDPVFDDDVESRRRAMLARLGVRGDPQQAITETIEAAELEIERQHPVEAERLLRRATELTEQYGDPRSRQSCHILLRLGSVATSNGSSDAVEVLLRAARLAIDLGDEHYAALATLEASRVGLGSTVGQADTEIAELIGECRSLPLGPADRARVDLAEMSVYGIGTDGARARTLLDAALSAAAEAGDPELVRIVQRAAYMAVIRPEDLPVRRSISADLRRHAEETGDRTYRYESMRLDFSIAVEAGERDPRPILAELEEMHAEFGERSRNWSLFAFQTVVAYLDGDLERVERGIERILSPETVVSMPLKLSTAGGHQLGLHLERGDLDQLDPIVAHIEASTPGLPAWLAARAATAAAAGDVDTARDRLRRSRRADGHDGLRLPDDFTGLPCGFLLGEAALTIGDDETLDLAIDALRPHSGLWLWHGTGTFGPVDLALARWAHARRDDTSVIQHFARSALVSARNVGAPPLVARAAALLAEHTPSTMGAR